MAKRKKKEPTPFKRMSTFLKKKGKESKDFSSFSIEKVTGSSKGRDIIVPKIDYINDLEEK